MLDTTKWLTRLLVLSSAMCSNPQVQAQTRAPSPATIEGRITVFETASGNAAAQPLRNLKVYLFNLGQSRPLQELQHKCRKATANPARGQATAFAAYDVCIKTLSDAVDLVPRLPSTASTKTDSDGRYKFDNVTAGQRYQVVLVKVEDGEPIVIVGLTQRLRPGEHVNLDLRENDPWTNADPL